MIEQRLALPGEIVKKHNDLIRTKINIASVDGARILATLIAQVRQDDTQFKKRYQISAKDFLSDLGGGSYTRLKSICRELANSTVEIEEPNPTNPKGHPIFRARPFFSDIVYKDGIIEASFNERMQPLLLNLRCCFTRYNLLEYLCLPSIYSQRVFEIIKSWGSVPEFVISVADLHKLLNTPASFRANFKALRIYVLEKAHKDIVTKTSLHYEWKPIKVGRSVEAVRFIVSQTHPALVAKELEKAKRAKKSRLTNRRFLRAMDCARAKKGNCNALDNKPIICKMCRQFNMCEEVRKSSPTRVGMNRPPSTGS